MRSWNLESLHEVLDETDDIHRDLEAFLNVS